MADNIFELSPAEFKNYVDSLDTEELTTFIHNMKRIREKHFEQS